MARHEHQDTRVIWGGRIMGANVRADAARQEARKAARAADRAEAESSVVDLHGRLRRTSAAVPNDRPMPEWWLRLAGDRMLPLQDAGKPAVGSHSPLAGYA